MNKLNPNKLPKTVSAIQKLARDQKNKQEKRFRLQGKSTYLEGDPTDKVWDNYQLTKALKRQFKQLCEDKNIVASKYLRACIRLLIKKEGDVNKALKAVEKLDSTNLET